MRNRSNAWVVPATAALLFVLVARSTRAAADPAVQAVADLVSQTDYQAYQLDTAVGLSVSVQGSYSNVVGELTGTTTPEKIGSSCLTSAFAIPCSTFDIQLSSQRSL